MTEAHGARLAALFGLADHHVLITGAASGLGRALAVGIAGCGAAVTLIDRDTEGLAATVSEIDRLDTPVGAWTVDIVDRAGMADAAAEAEARHGPLDGWVNCAGIGRRSAAIELSETDWNAVIEINLGGTFLCCQIAGRLMLPRRRGSIVNVSSIAGQVGLRTGNANYAASKGGVDALTRTLAVEWASDGVRVNAIAPTHFRTVLLEDAVREDPGRLRYFEGNIPLGRLGEPSEVVGPVVFLLSDAASMVTGHVLNVDGGHAVS